jgi:hypothetical protein
MKGKRMLISGKIKILNIMVLLMLCACSGQNLQDPTIATAVALTVAAQNTAQADTATPAASPTPIVTQTALQFLPTFATLPTIASPTLPGNTTKSQCARASLISETIPDGTIFKPDEQFTKTWEIKNESSCTWDTSYKIVFWDGDVLGGGYVYNLPQITPPGGTVPISLVLIAPSIEDTFRSEWMLQTPDGTEFGVGEYGAPFFTEIVVSNAKHPDYSITKVEYDIVRDPPTGCPANVRWTVFATVTTSGPFEFSYFWTQKDGNNSSPKLVEIPAAGSKTFSRLWVIGLAATPGQKWIEFNVSAPFEKAYGKAVWDSTCGQP